MHPILIDLHRWLGVSPDWNPSTYTTLIAAGFILGMWLSRREAIRVGLDPVKVVDIYILIIILSLVGARLLFIIVEWRTYAADPAALLDPFRGGLVFYGGLLGGIAAVLIGVWRFKLPWWRIADLYIPWVAQGQFFGRLGCFGAGCCWGGETSHSNPFHIIYSQPGIEHVRANIPMHPTQLYEAFGVLGIYFYLIWLRSRKTWHGQVFIHYLVLYAILRSVVEIFRGDAPRGFVIEPWLSTSQFIAAVLTAAAAALAFRRAKTGRLPSFALG
ncbi:MAG: Prolipoprotein diacylglyceryl transferase [Myxococcota bacterium]|nr:Prolipoprotein diacylglyceryl transferase [Myxococcota bacterium]